jgi:hypothetical protein
MRYQKTKRGLCSMFDLFKSFSAISASLRALRKS